MKEFRKRFVLCAAACLLAGGCGLSAAAQPRESGPDAEIDRLYAQLAEPGREDWQRIETAIERLWSRSGSDSMDLLLERGREALGAEDIDTALHCFSALTDHAPGFAEGWNARATTFFMMEEYALAISDIEHALLLNPRHFDALQGLGIMFEQMGESDLALRAFRAARDINPNQPDVTSAVERLEREKGAAEL